MTDFIFPLSADPPHQGHLRVVQDFLTGERDSTLTVVVMNSGLKHPLFSLDERLAMTRDLFSKTPVQVISSDRPLIDVWHEQNCPNILRGIRNPADLEFEWIQRSHHALLEPRIWGSFIFHEIAWGASKSLEPKDIHYQISSSLIKGMVAQGFWVHEWVSPKTERILRYRILGQNLWNVTGRIGTGKSTLINGLQNVLESRVVHVDVDRLVWDIWDEDSPRGRFLRSKLPEPCVNRVDRQVVRELSVAGKLSNVIQVSDVERKIRKTIGTQGGTVFIEWALTAEMGLAHWGTHQTILTTMEHPSSKDPAYVEACKRRQMTWRDAETTLRKASEDAVVHLYGDEIPEVFWESCGEF